MDEALKKYDQILVDHQIKKLQIYSERVVKWNKYINLTGARDSTIFFEQHVIDCLSVIPFLKKGICHRCWFRMWLAWFDSSYSTP